MTVKRLLGEHHCKMILKNLNNEKIAAWNFSRKGAKIVNSLTLRLCVRLFPRLSAHAVSHNSQIGALSAPLRFQFPDSHNPNSDNKQLSVKATDMTPMAFDLHC